MRLHQSWTSALIALFVLTGAAFAEVTVSQSNDPKLEIGQEFRTLLGAEHRALSKIPEERRTALATGGLNQSAKERGTRSGLGALFGKKKQKTIALDYSLAFLQSLPSPSGDAEWQCLTKALYFEARGEGLKGQFAVAEVILNRVDSANYPGTVCGVVEQGSKGSCQFSYHCDGARDVMREAAAADTAARIARIMLDGAPRSLTFGATHFHTRGVNPVWSHRFEKTAAIGAHLFYKP